MHCFGLAVAFIRMVINVVHWTNGPLSVNRGSVGYAINVITNLASGIQPTSRVSIRQCRTKQRNEPNR